MDVETLPYVEQASVKAKAFYVSRLILTNFRNYASLSMNLDDRPVVITGANGSGKTNILEAVSLLSPGRGIRKIKLNEADKISADRLQPHPWAISSVINCGDEETRVGTGRDPLSESNKRIVKIDGDIVRGNAELANIFSVMWLTPQMDGIFIGSNSDRRKFLDRLVYNFDPEHASRIYSYEYTMRERSKLLQTNGDASWLAILENKMAERAIAISAARIDAIEIIGQSILQSDTVFPKAIIGIEGVVEDIFRNKTALQAEENLRQKLFDGRSYDASTGRTSIGTHRSDFTVVHLEKNMPAASCSTGEQKALLISIILAEARAKSAWKNRIPVLLLDEVVAHLDVARRQSLFNELLAVRSQVWMTGTDDMLFEDLRNHARFISVNDGVVT